LVLHGRIRKMNLFFVTRTLIASLVCSPLLLGAAAALAADPPTKASGAPRMLTEDELSAKIAAKLVQLRAEQAARMTAVAKAKKAAAAPASVAPARTVHGTKWSYEGETGPAHWSGINPDWASCSNGTRQSPIDIRDGIKLDLDPIVFDYHPSSFTIVDNGHTVEVALGAGNFITIMNRRYELQQFHFHRPSEERINGKGFDMSLHLVHKDDAGRQAVVALLLERGTAQSAIQTVWNNLPLEKNDIIRPTTLFDANDLLPVQREYFIYMGSMATPPCSEGVLWMVMKQPVPAAPAQMALFSRLYPYNVRPTQPSSGRIIKESN
jgi:carbonic anhydrase